MHRFPLLPQSVLTVSLVLSSVLIAQDAPKPDAPKPAAPATIAQKTAGMKHLDGFMPLDWDAKAGKLYLEISRLNADGRTTDLLYVNSLPYGTGSNDLGLDRGQLSEGVVAYFERIGPKVLLVETNQRFRSGSSDADEQLAVTQSFPESVLWGFKVEAESADGATVLVDATDFFLHDAHRRSRDHRLSAAGIGAQRQLQSSMRAARRLCPTTPGRSRRTRWLKPS